MFRCPACSSTKGFIKDIYPCLVAVIVDADLEEKGDLNEVLDYAPARRANVIYQCVECGYRCKKKELEKTLEKTKAS